MGELVDTLVERFGGGVPRKQCTPRGNGIGERKEKYERDKRKGKTKGLRLLPSAGPWRALTWFKRWLCQIPQQSVAGTVLSPSVAPTVAITHVWQRSSYCTRSSDGKSVPDMSALRDLGTPSEMDPPRVRTQRLGAGLPTYGGNACLRSW